MLPLFLTRSLFLSRCQAFCSALCVWQSSGFYRGHCVPVVLRSGPMKVRHMRTHKLHLNTLRKDLFCFNKKICDSALSNSCANTCTYTHIVLRIRDRFLCQLFWALLTYLDCKYLWDIKLLQQNGRRKHIFNFFFFFKPSAFTMKNEIVRRAVTREHLITHFCSNKNFIVEPFWP